MRPKLLDSVFGEIIQIVIGALIVCVLSFAFLDGNITLGIYAGVFIVLFYFVLRSNFLAKMFDDVDKGKDDSFFSSVSLSIIITAVLVFFGTRLIAGIIDSQFVDYCKKEGWLYSEQRCAYQQAREAVAERFESSDFSDDSGY